MQPSICVRAWIKFNLTRLHSHHQGWKGGVRENKPKKRKPSEDEKATKKKKKDEEEKDEKKKDKSLFEDTKPKHQLLKAKSLPTKNQRKLSASSDAEMNGDAKDDEGKKDETNESTKPAAVKEEPDETKGKKESDNEGKKESDYKKDSDETNESAKAAAIKEEPDEKKDSEESNEKKDNEESSKKKEDKEPKEKVKNENGVDHMDAANVLLGLSCGGSTTSERSVSPTDDS
jgi:hypothetical protein